MMDVRSAALAVLRASDANIAALNGQGHPGKPHDRVLHRLLRGDVQIFDAVGDCSACGGAQYGAEDTLQQAMFDLRVALGEPPKPWEAYRVPSEPDGALTEAQIAAARRAFVRW